MEQSNQTFSTFVSKNHDWLQSHLFSDELETLLTPSKSVTGHPSADWSSLSDCSKGRKVRELTSQNDTLKFYSLLHLIQHMEETLTLGMSYNSPQILQQDHQKWEQWYQIKTDHKSLLHLMKLYPLLVDTNMTKQAYQTSRPCLLPNVNTSTFIHHTMTSKTLSGSAILETLRSQSILQRSLCRIFSITQHLESRHRNPSQKLSREHRMGKTSNSL